MPVELNHAAGKLLTTKALVFILHQYEKLPSQHQLMSSYLLQFYTQYLHFEYGFRQMQQIAGLALQNLAQICRCRGVEKISKSTRNNKLFSLILSQRLATALIDWLREISKNHEKE